MKIRGRASSGEPSARSDEGLSADALAAKLADLKNSQSELAQTIELLAGQIDSLQKTEAEVPPGSEPVAPPPPPPPGFAIDTPSSAKTTPPPPPPGPSNQPHSPPPPPPPGIGTKPAPAPPPPPKMAAPPRTPPAVPPPDSASTLSPLDRLLGEDFGKPRVPGTTQTTQAPPAPTTAKPPATQPPPAPTPAKPSAPEVAAEKPGPTPDPEPTFRVALPLDDEPPTGQPDKVEPPSPVASASSQSQAAAKPVSPYSFNAKLDQLRDDEPAINGQGKTSSPPNPAPPTPAKVSVGAGSEGAVGTATEDEPMAVNQPAPDFFRTGGQSFASAAAMVNDILEATPDTTPEPGKDHAEDSADPAADEPRAPDVPITPDFFTAQPKKRFRFRR